MSILKEIESGESKTLELKEMLPSHESIAKTVIAFSNTSGGKIIIGVNDQRKITGLGEQIDVFELQDKVASIIYDHCAPNIIPEIYTTNSGGKIMLVIEVFRGSILPYYLKKAGKTEGVYIRVGATNRKASFENIVELERQRRNSSFDQEANEDIRFDSLDITSIKEKFKQVGKEFNLNTLKNLKLIQEKQDVMYPTNGLLILLGFYDHCTIKCSRFKGTTMDVFLDRKEYSGDIFTQLDEAENFIKNHLQLKSEISSLQREDHYEIPIEAIRESLVNAVVHRDYANVGRDIKIGIYDDLLNIVSPGGFPSTITQEDILEGRSEIRNKVIARVLKELNYIEQWGSGIRRIKSTCADAGLQEPDIEEKGDFVNANLYRQLDFSKQETKPFLSLSEQEIVILDYLKKGNGKIATKETEILLNIGERRVREIFNDMVDKGILEKVKKGPKTHYRIAMK